jgi:hypothetical protein
LIAKSLDFSQKELKINDFSLLRNQYQELNMLLFLFKAIDYFENYIDKFEEKNFLKFRKSFIQFITFSYLSKKST